MGTSTLCTVRVSGRVFGEPIDEIGQFPRNTDGTVNAFFTLPNGNNLILDNLPCPTTPGAPLMIIIPQSEFDLMIDVVEA